MSKKILNCFHLVYSAFEYLDNMYGYCPKVRSRWLDIGQVLFLRVYGPRLRLGP